jgi:Ca-activated chloride channel family protein
MRRGIALERKGNYQEAVKAFQEALVLEPDDVRIHYDIGRAQYEMKQHGEALEHFRLGLLSKSRPLRAKSLYNMGNCHYRQQQLDEAITSYTQALLQKPNNLQAKQNLEFCWKMKAQQQQQPPDSTQQKPQQQPQQPQQPQQTQRPQQPQQAEAQKGAISKDQANRMLQTLQSREKERLKNQPKPPQERNAGGRDW